MRPIARSKTTAATSRIAAPRYDWSTRSWIAAIPATMALARARAPTIVAARRGSPSDMVGSFRRDRRPDLLEAGARAVQLARLERVIAETRQLEKPRELLDGDSRQREPRQRLAHEFARGLPRRAGHSRLCREALESPVAADDRGPRF